jgi:hypothetical protein
LISETTAEVVPVPLQQGYGDEPSPSSLPPAGRGEGSAMRRGVWSGAILAGALLLNGPAAGQEKRKCPFADVPPHHWAHDSVTVLTSLGLFDGYPSFTFGGQKAVTRYALAVTLQRVKQDFLRSMPDNLRLRSTPDACFPTPGGHHRSDEQERKRFSDVPPDHWAAEAVEELSSAGVVRGYPDGRFYGDRSMTRYEVAVALHRSMLDCRRSSPEPLAWPVGPTAPPLLSGIPRSHWAANAVDELRRWGIEVGYPGGAFAGHRLMTR